MVEKFVNNNIERIEKQGSGKFVGIKKYKSMRSWISSRIQMFSRSGNAEYEFSFREILNAYNHFHPVVREEQIEFKGSKLWKPVEDKIKISTIKRYNWIAVFGHTLTEEILRIKKLNYDVDQCYALLYKNQAVLEFIAEFPDEKNKILDNLKTSVHARYGENNTAKRVELEE